MSRERDRLGSQAASATCLLRGLGQVPFLPWASPGPHLFCLPQAFSFTPSLIPTWASLLWSPGPGSPPTSVDRSPQCSPAHSSPPGLFLVSAHLAPLLCSLLDLQPHPRWHLSPSALASTCAIRTPRAPYSSSVSLQKNVPFLSGRVT